MALNWINPDDYSFNAFLLLEPFQIRLMFNKEGWRNNKEEWRAHMGVALAANPAVKWYFLHRCPSAADIINSIALEAPLHTDAPRIREAEKYALMSVEDFIIHTTPEKMAENCQYIKEWDRERLYEMADFAGKTVLDVGAGSGRLTFAAAVYAKEVYAAEPVGTLREFIRNKAKALGITNIRVTEALVESIPYPNNTFDIVMSGHVVGDSWDDEIAELTRVCKPGGWLLDCPGDESFRKVIPRESDMLVIRGFERLHYVGNGGGDVYRYLKQIDKK